MPPIGRDGTHERLGRVGSVERAAVVGWRFPNRFSPLKDQEAVWATGLNPVDGSAAFRGAVPSRDELFLSLVRVTSTTEGDARAAGAHPALKERTTLVDNPLYPIVTALPGSCSGGHLWGEACTTMVAISLGYSRLGAWIVMLNLDVTLASCLFGVMLLGAATVHAQEVRLNAHGPSSHFGSRGATNNGWTFGGGGEVRWERGAWEYGAVTGGYYNSVWNTTLYVGLTGSYRVTDWLGVGVGVSAATGYDGDVCYEMETGKTSCYQLSWARPVTILPLPFIAIGDGVEFRLGGFSNLESGMMHVMVSVPLRAGG